MADTATLTESPPNRFVRLLAFLGPDYTMFFSFAIMFIVLGLVYGAGLRLWEGAIFMALGGVAFVMLTRFLYQARPIMRDEPGARQTYRRACIEIMRDWSPLVLVTILFEHLHNFTGVIRKVPIDDYLYQLDVHVFGIEPSVWMGRISSPLLTDYFAFTYALYFILPMILCVSLSIRGRRGDFREVCTAVVIHMCLGFLLFIMFPAGPPRFYEPLQHGGFQPAHLSSAIGIWEYSQDVWDSANSVKDHSSFPSMHCCLGLLTLLYSWKYGSGFSQRFPKLFFWICLPLITSLVISTVYLRHHWVPDCVAGMLLAVAVFTLVPWLRRVWPRGASLANG